MQAVTGGEIEHALRRREAFAVRVGEAKADLVGSDEWIFGTTMQEVMI